MPAIEALRARFDLPLSVDTWRASVARACFEAGAVVGNDISGFADPDYLATCAAGGRVGGGHPHPPGATGARPRAGLRRRGGRRVPRSWPTGRRAAEAAGIPRRADHGRRRARPGQDRAPVAGAAAPAPTSWPRSATRCFLSASNKRFLWKLLDVDVRRGRPTAPSPPTPSGIGLGCRVLRCPRRPRRAAGGRRDGRGAGGGDGRRAPRSTRPSTWSRATTRCWWPTPCASWSTPPGRRRRPVARWSTELDAVDATRTTAATYAHRAAGRRGPDPAVPDRATGRGGPPGRGVLHRRLGGPAGAPTWPTRCPPPCWSWCGRRARARAPAPRPCPRSWPTRSPPPVAWWSTPSPAPGRQRTAWLDEHLAAAPVQLDAAAKARAGRPPRRGGEPAAHPARHVRGRLRRRGPAERATTSSPTSAMPATWRPWDLTDAIDRGDAQAALGRARPMLGAGRHPLQITASLHGHYQRMLRLDGSGVANEAQAAEMLGIKGLDLPGPQGARPGPDAGLRAHPGVHRPAGRRRPRPARGQGVAAGAGGRGAGGPAGQRARRRPRPASRSSRRGGAAKLSPRAATARAGRGRFRRWLAGQVLDQAGLAPGGLVLVDDALAGGLVEALDGQAGQLVGVLGALLGGGGGGLGAGLELGARPPCCARGASRSACCA